MIVGDVRGHQNWSSRLKAMAANGAGRQLVDIGYNKKDGYRQRNASVSAISLRHNLATSGESRRYVVALIHPF